MNRNIKKMFAITIMLALVVGCFAALPWTANAASAPVPGIPAWDAKYNGFFNTGANNLKGEYYDRGNAAGDKISSNAHSGDYPGVYFRWDEKQKCPGVFLVADWVFDLFEEETFYLTAKNSNSYYKYLISRDTGHVINEEEAVWGYGIPKEVMGKDNKGKDVKDELKNINMVFIDGIYKAGQFFIEKTWYDEDGDEINDRAALDEQLAFNNNYDLGRNTVKIADYPTAVKGKSVTVTEMSTPTGFAPVIGTKTSVTVKATWNGEDTAEFFNQKQRAEIFIEKIWLDHNGDEIEDTTGLEARFTINGEPANLGSNKVKEGKYTVSEVYCSNGFELISDNDVEVTVSAGESVEVVFTNQDPIHEPELKLVKTVDGKIIATWLKENPQYKLADLGMDFIVYDAEFVGDNLRRNIDGTPYYDVDAPIASLTPDEFGVIDVVDALIKHRGASFGGTYIVVESFAPGSTAERIFDGTAPPMVITISVEGKIVLVDGKIVSFGYEDLYTIVNGYDLGGYRISTLGYPGLNNNGDIFYIGVTNTKTGVTYSSFCAHAGSKTFAGAKGCDGYLVAYSYKTPNAVVESTVDYAVLISALNYIEDTYGTLDTYDNRVITQTVIWALLPNADGSSKAVDVTSDTFITGTNLTPDEKKAVCDTLDAAYDGYKGNGKIVDVVYMLCANHGDSEFGLENCQPQLVPIYNVAINNKLRDNPPTGDVSFNKVKYDGLLPIAVEEEFAFDLFKLVNGAEAYHGIFYNDADGVVTATGLEPGSYVFREVVTADFYDAIPGVNGEVWGYRFVWQAFYPNGDDGLYFEIDANGKTIWPEGYIGEGAEVPTVNNKLVPKTDKLWELTKTTGAPGLEIEEYLGKEGGFIRSNAGCGGILQATVIEATCTTPEIVRLTCDCGGDSNHLSHVGIDITRGKALEHDVSYTTTWNYGECYQVCSRGCSLPPCDNEEFWNTCGDKCGHTWADLTAAVTSCADCGQTVNTNTLPSLQP